VGGCSERCARMFTDLACAQVGGAFMHGTRNSGLL